MGSDSAFKGLMWYIGTPGAEPKSPLVPHNVTKDKIKKIQTIKVSHMKYNAIVN
jgi:hypothetical protein